MHMQSTTYRLDRAADAIANAQCLILSAGAGMGVDSGLPDFRGQGGLYSEDSIFASYGYDMKHLVSPLLLHENPRLAWGVMTVIHRLFSRATPHEGFDVLKRWTRTRPYFIHTSNVDGQFQKAGFDEDRIVEVHGSVHYLQPNMPETQEDEIWPVGELGLEVDLKTGMAIGDLPTVPGTDALARLNILMFGDFHWLITRTHEQETHYEAWRENIRPLRCTIIECGAGTALPTVHHHANRLFADMPKVDLVRINPSQVRCPDGAIHIEMGAREALLELENKLVAIGA